MIASKTIDLLRTFTQAEFREFGLFVSSPYFNKEKIIVRFYDVIRAHHPGFDSRSFVKEKVFARLYPGKNYSDGVMRNILSTTLGLAFRFLAINRLERDDIQFENNILSELNLRKQNKLYERKYELLNELLAEIKIKDADYYYKKFLVSNEQRKYNTRLKSSLATDENVLTELSESLSVSFMINMLRIHTYIANTNKYMLHYQQNKSLMEGIEHHILTNFENYENITSLVYYFNFYMLSKTRQEKYFYRLSDLFGQKYDELSVGDRNSAITMLANYCYTMINKGELKFLGEQFKIYKRNVETGYYKGERGFMSHIFFINVVVTGLEAGEDAWVRDFIEKYHDELDSVNRDNTYTFTRAFYCYWNRDYSLSLQLAASVKTDDPSYKHQLKSLYLKIYFDLNEIETFYSHIDSYKHFIASDKNISDGTRLVVNNYINTAKKLFDIKTDGKVSEEELALLRMEVINNKAMINKPWLLRKIEETYSR